MDPLTEKLLERARARRETLARKMAESNMSPRKSTVPERTPLGVSQQQNLVQSTFSGKAVSPMKLGQTIKPDTPAIPSVRTRLQKLADQRQIWNSSDGTEVDSPKNVIPPKRPDFDEVEQQAPPPKAPMSRRSRFAALAANINSWEDDTDHPRHAFEKEKPATRRWQPPKKEEPAAEPSPVPAKRSAPHTTSSDLGTAQTSARASPPKRAKFEGDESTLHREPSGKVGSRVSSSSEDDSDAGLDQPVPAPRQAKTTTVGSPVKTHMSSASPVKRPTMQSCTAATPKSQSPQKRSTFRQQSPQKTSTPTITRSPIKQKSPLKKNSPVKQHPATVKASPMKKKPYVVKNALPKKGATSENFARAMVLLQQGCGGGGASRQMTSPVKTAPKVGAMAQQIQDRLRENQSSWQKNAINTKIQEERQKEMALIRARWEGGGTSTTATKTEPSQAKRDNTEDERENAQDTEEEMEEANTTEEDATESNTEDEEIVPEPASEETADVGIVPMTIERSAAPTGGSVAGDLEVEAQQEGADESEVNISDVLGDIDELIVEAEQAMKAEQVQAQEQAMPPTQPPTSKADTSGWDFGIDQVEPLYAKVSKPAHSSSSSSSSSMEEEGYPVPAPRGSERPLRRNSSTSSDDSCVSTATTASSTLTPHSLASYRSQQKTLSPTTVTHRTVARETASRRVVREESTASTASSSSSSSSSSSRGGEQGRRQQKQQAPRGPSSQGDGGKKRAKRMNPKEKIQTLMEEVSAQQSIIQQTSHALELIAATEEYHGTREEIEAERLLVVATQRRQACLSEIQYLKVPAAPPRCLVTEDGQEIVPCRGSVTLRDIRLPLKTQYLMALDSGRDQAHHSFFVIVRCKERVIATQILSTREITGDCLHFTNLVCLNDLGSDFTVELLVYEMRGRCATTDAVHSKKAASSKHGWSLTPKKFRQGGRYPQSPALSAHSTVRQNSFAMVGSARLSLASCQLKKVTLTKVPFLSPLEGSIHLTMACHTDSQTHAEGFLTMFDDCSGLGMWHRRWCVLHGGNLSFWKYPGDEKRKPPIGTIDLKECITREVRLISRIHCARPNTFELQTSRPSAQADHQRGDTLVSKRSNSHVITKHLLSADTKEDRVEWCTALNKTLLELRLWCKDAVRPTHE